MQQRLRVGVLFGGRSSEHEVSLMSAASVINALDRNKYVVVPIGITREGHWLVKGDPLARLQRLAQEGGKAEAPSASEVHISPGSGGATFLLPFEGDAEGAGGFAALSLDVIFPILHGPYGEDGSVQGLLEICDLPYVGAGIVGSAVGMDKVLMKAAFASRGLPQLRFITCLRWQLEGGREKEIVRQVGRELGYPCFVKPANMGSSVGVSKVRSEDELPRALRFAACFDRKVIIEEAARDCREVECSVLGNEDPHASVPGEILPANEFYDYEAKYLDEASKAVVPAPLDGDVTARIRSLAVEAFKAVDCAGMARVDFFVSRCGEVYVNEINTIPGFTRISLYPKLWEASGLPYPQLLDRLIELAMERYRDRRRNQVFWKGETGEE